LKNELKTKGAFVIEEKTGTPQYRHWLQTIESTLRWLKVDHWNGWESWKSAYLLHRGRHWTHAAKNTTDQLDFASDDMNNAMTVNRIGSHIQNLLPFLLRTDPHFIGEPRREEDLDSAAAQGDILNHFWKVQKFQRQLKLCALDFLVMGNMFAKTGFTLEVDEAKLKAAAKTKAATTEYYDAIRKQAPWFKRINPFQFLIDPSAPDRSLETARWCAEIIYKPFQDVILNEEYDKKTRKMLQSEEHSPTTVLEFEDEWHSGDGDAFIKEKNPETEDRKSQFIVLYEIWDKRSRKRLVMAAGIERPLLEVDWPHDYLAGFPYVMAKFIELPNELYGVGHAKFVEDQQKALNRLRSKEMAMATAFVPQRQGPALDEADATAVRNGIPLAYIKIPASAEHPITEVPTPRLPPDHNIVTQHMEEDFRELASIDALINGGPLPARTSATEVRARQKLFGLKLEDNVAAMNEFVYEVAMQTLAHCKANLQAPMWVRTLGRSGTQYIQISPGDIKDEVDIELISTNKEPEDPLTKRQQALQLLQTISGAVPNLLQLHNMQTQMLQSLPEQQFMVNVFELMRYVTEQFDAKELDRIFPVRNTMPPVIPGEFPQPAPAGPAGQEQLGLGGANDPEAAANNSDQAQGGVAAAGVASQFGFQEQPKGTSLL
jgi:hypothetical protein